MLSILSVNNKTRDCVDFPQKNCLGCLRPALNKGQSKIRKFWLFTQSLLSPR